MSFVNNMYVICGLYEYFYESPKTPFFVSKRFGTFFLIHKDGKPNYKNESIERKILKKYAK